MMAPVMIFRHCPAATLPCQALPARAVPTTSSESGGIGLELPAVEGIAVHGRVVVRRHADGRHQVVGQHPIERIEDRNFLGLLHRLDQASQEIVHRRCAECLRVVALQLRGDLRDAFHDRSS